MRIVFASLGSLGDLHPIIALAQASLERGHTPVIAASETYRDYIASLDYEFFPIRPDFQPDPALFGRMFHPTRGPARLMQEQIFPNIRGTYSDLVTACAEADLLVVGELLYAAPLVAAKLGIEWANVILAPTSFLSACDPCVLAPAPLLYPLRHLGAWTHQIIFALGRFTTLRWSAPLQEFRRELGLPPGPSPIFDGKHSPSLVLAMFPSFLAAPQADWPRIVVQTGFPFFAQPPRPETLKKLNAFLADGPAPIVFTLGSSVVHIAENFYQSASDAARQLGRRAILLVGRNPVPANLPDSILALDYVPLEFVLPHASAVVHQGGIGTCGEALRAGIPSLVIPFGFDQPDNAERLRQLGVARIIHRHRLSTVALVKNLRAIQETPAMTTRAKELSRRIHPEAELSAALDAIERLGARSSVLAA